MSRSGYIEDLDDQWGFIRWRGAVASAIRGRKGQGFLVEMLDALDALPAPRLIGEALERDGDVCALGSVGRARGLDMSQIDVEDWGQLAQAFGISEALARQLMYLNDDAFSHETPESRFASMRKWIERNIKKEGA